jgi:CRISPR-associated protein (TIGR02710 family)
MTINIMPEVMILSVGGSKEPIIKSLSCFKPHFAVFIASQETNLELGRIIEGVQKDVNSKMESVVEITSDHQALEACFNAATAAIDKAIKWADSRGIDRKKIMVDFTGGTKCMSVALSYAAAEYGLTFSYVGGIGRTKEGVGVVIDGKEKIFSAVNPWILISRDEKLKIAELFNSCQYFAALTQYKEYAEKTSEYKSFHKRFVSLLSGYYQWDLFRHIEAVKDFKTADPGTMRDLKGCDGLEDFISDSVLRFEILKKISEKSHQAGGGGYKPSYLHLTDLIANALRRRKEGKMDDAILRLYRVIEMAAQICLYDKWSLDTSRASPEKIPESLREEFIKRYGNTDRQGMTFCKLPQDASLRILAELKDDTGIRYKEEEKKFQALQVQRNNSYLAHGCNSSKEETLDSLESFVFNITGINKEEIVSFPRLEFKKSVISA